MLCCVGRISTLFKCAGSRGLEVDNVLASLSYDPSLLAPLALPSAFRWEPSIGTLGCGFAAQVQLVRFKWWSLFVLV